VPNLSRGGEGIEESPKSSTRPSNDPRPAEKECALIQTSAAHAPAVKEGKRPKAIVNAIVEDGGKRYVLP